jgi:hypothetical protein
MLTIDILLDSMFEIRGMWRTPVAWTEAVLYEEDWKVTLIQSVPLTELALQPMSLKSS